MSKISSLYNPKPNYLLMLFSSHDRPNILTMSRSSTIPFKVISATCEGNGIGKGNDLPWSLKEEMAYFHRMTRTTVDRRLENALLMGRRTWESIPPQERPFPGRVSIVLSQTMCKETKDNVRVCRSYEEAVEAVDCLYDKIETCWVMGIDYIYYMLYV